MIEVKQIDWSFAMTEKTKKEVAFRDVVIVFRRRQRSSVLYLEKHKNAFTAKTKITCMSRRAFTGAIQL